MGEDSGTDGSGPVGSAGGVEKFSVSILYGLSLTTAMSIKGARLEDFYLALILFAGFVAARSLAGFAAKIALFQIL